jgi:hypothetical protein
MMNRTFFISALSLSLFLCGPFANSSDQQRNRHAASAIAKSKMKLLVVSDIDDTIRMTGVSNKPKVLVKNFIIGQEFRPYPWLIKFYSDLEKSKNYQETKFYYLSSSPSALDVVNWLKKNRAPSGDIRQRNFYEVMTKKSRIYKEEALKFYLRNHLRSLKKGEHLDILMFGDNGEADPLVYQSIINLPEFSKDLRLSFKIFIRTVDLKKEPLEDAHFIAFENERLLFESDKKFFKKNLKLRTAREIGKCFPPEEEERSSFSMLIEDLGRLIAWLTDEREEAESL